MHKIVKNLSVLIAGLTAGVVLEKKKKEAVPVADSNKYWQAYLMMNEWMQLRQKGRNLSEFFAEKGYKTIAIYGMHYTGITLQNELDGTGIQIAYGIDANAESIYSDIEVKKPTDDLPPVDVIVVTPIYYFIEIEEKLEGRVTCPILSLDDVVFGM